MLTALNRRLTVTDLALPPFRLIANANTKRRAVLLANSRLTDRGFTLLNGAAAAFASALY